MAKPLILTLAIDEKASRFFTALRKMYAPPGMPVVDACLPLFNLLPNEPEVIGQVQEFARDQHPIELQVKEPVHSGSSIFYQLESSALQQLHTKLQQQWQTFLIPQDLQPLEPTITIQEEMSPDAARELMALLKENFGTFTTIGTGLQLWEYGKDRGILVKEFSFPFEEDKGKTS